MPHSKKVVFKNKQGQELVGFIDFFSKSNPAFALFAHCFTCSKDLKAIRTIAQALSESGLNVLRFDFTGLGMSEGSFEHTNFSSNVQDLISATDFLRQHFSAPSLLLGHSLGGAAILAAAPDIPEAKAVATIGAPSTPDHILKHFQNKESAILSQGYAQVSLGGKSFVLQKQFLEDLRDFELKSKIKSLNKALLIFHSPVDEVVPIAEAGKIYMQAKHPKSFISLDNADHLLTESQDAQYVAQTLQAWASRYLEPSPELSLKPSRGEVVVQSFSKFQQKVTTDHHKWWMDEPNSAGGDDTGPDPYETLLASLGGCTNMTINLYAEFKGLEIDSLTTKLKHRREHRQDCEDCSNKADALDTIIRNIEITGPQIDEQILKKIEQIANKCPVHKTLTREAYIETYVELGTEIIKESF